ncbi:hypothetical protein V5799_032020 [Amblyomma americanum]|uniref:Uncharacterized protein n=1 Tax=Amblyomma americanum TaxID=6943 RepID=A0AAQ4DSD1_AMBAM
MKTLHEQLGSLFSIQMSLVQVACRLRESHQSLLLTIKRRSENSLEGCGWSEKQGETSSNIMVLKSLRWASSSILSNHGFVEVLMVLF